MIRIVSLTACLTFACAPAHAGPPFLTDDPVPTLHHTYEIHAFAVGDVAPGGRASRQDIQRGLNAKSADRWDDRRFRRV